MTVIKRRTIISGQPLTYLRGWTYTLCILYIYFYGHQVRSTPNNNVIFAPFTLHSISSEKASASVTLLFEKAPIRDPYLTRLPRKFIYRFSWTGFSYLTRQEEEWEIKETYQTTGLSCLWIKILDHKRFVPGGVKWSVKIDIDFCLSAAQFFPALFDIFESSSATNNTNFSGSFSHCFMLF